MVLIIGQVWPLKADEAVPQSNFEQAVPAVIVYLVHSRAGLKSNITALTVLKITSKSTLWLLKS